ncbi:tetratricopeptide repeat protein [uncultured Aquimarina sp.]|uniref:tetratricopeptide repeat protein n=1 Tax=uncultured Aquimarina sp. TaxID=575652 RepID=UPI00260AD071|nr:tetratricopeptide repeat protein [uncultured Aquimarina sp.]
MKNIELNILREIDKKVREAEELFLLNEREKAIIKYKELLDLIPEPKHSWNESWAFFYGLSELYFQNNQFPEALDYLEECVQCPHAIGNPHVHLRIGQIRYELGQIEKAKDELMRAYMGGTIEIFEKEDQKYFSLIQKHVNHL